MKSSVQLLLLLLLFPSGNLVTYIYPNWQLHLFNFTVEYTNPNYDTVK